LMERIRSHTWPGNVRELENALERGFLFCDGDELTELELETGSDAQPHNWSRIRDDVVRQAEQTYLSEALRRHRGDVAAVAREMGLTARAVYQKLKRHGLSAAAFRD